MKIELHMIQNFAPSCLNRDDTNSPKDCIFGGVRRARISSQCIKQAIRTSFKGNPWLPVGNLGCRTKRLLDETCKLLANEKKRDANQARAIVAAALGGIGLSVDDEGQTQYLLFLGWSAISTLAAVCDRHWDALAKIAPSTPGTDRATASDKNTKKSKKEAKQSFPDDLKEELAKVLDGASAVDLALFGRMLADMPDKNIDAACQVAHAISAHKVDMEMDFFTAVDDLKSDQEDPGAGMMGVIGFNSACFYRYAVLDFDQLVGNLGGDKELARRTVEAFLRASAVALPTGKQNTFAAHSRPDLILAVLQNGSAPLSLANAFVRPARPTEQKDLTQASVDQLAEYWSKVATVFGDDSPVFFCGLTTPTETPAAWQDASSLDGLVKRVMAAIEGASS